MIKISTLAILGSITLGVVPPLLSSASTPIATLNNNLGETRSLILTPGDGKGEISCPFQWSGSTGTLVSDGIGDSVRVDEYGSSFTINPGTLSIDYDFNYINFLANNFQPGTWYSYNQLRYLVSGTPAATNLRMSLNNSTINTELHDSMYVDVRGGCIGQYIKNNFSSVESITYNNVNLDPGIGQAPTTYDFTTKSTENTSFNGDFHTNVGDSATSYSDSSKDYFAYISTKNNHTSNGSENQIKPNQTNSTVEYKLLINGHDPSYYTEKLGWGDFLQITMDPETMKPIEKMDYSIIKKLPDMTQTPRVLLYQTVNDVGYTLTMPKISCWTSTYPNDWSTTIDINNLSLVKGNGTDASSNFGSLIGKHWEEFTDDSSDWQFTAGLFYYFCRYNPFLYGY